MATTWRTPIEPRPVIGPYLVTVILFVVHVYEEYLAPIEQQRSLTQGREPA